MRSSFIKFVVEYLREHTTCEAAGEEDAEDERDAAEEVRVGAEEGDEEDDLDDDSRAVKEVRDGGEPDVATEVFASEEDARLRPLHENENKRKEKLCAVVIEQSVSPK